MARTNIPVIPISRPGVSVGNGTGEVNGDVANGMAFYNDGKTILHVRNTDAAPQTVTVPPSIRPDGQFPGGYSATIPNGQEFLLGPWPTANHSGNDPADNGDTFVTATSANLKFKAYRLPV